MPKPSAVKRQPPTPEQVTAEQERQARKLTEARKAAAPLPEAKNQIVPAAPAAVAAPAPDTRTSVQKYLDEVAPPASIVGRLIKFSKDGKFVFADTGEPVDENAEYIALCGETLVGWIRFFNDNETPPERVMGLLYDGFVMPARNTLGSMDEAAWPLGLSGQPTDVWQHQMCLVLQQVTTGELATFATTSDTGRRGVGKLLRHYDRMQRSNPEELPVVRLRPGGFNHRDPRVGWVPTPTFAIVGRAPRDSAAKPDTGGAGDDMNDQIPF